VSCGSSSVMHVTVSASSKAETLDS